MLEECGDSMTVPVRLGFALATLVAIGAPSVDAEPAPTACELTAEKLFGIPPTRVGTPDQGSIVAAPKKLRGATPRFPHAWPQGCRGTMFVHEALIAPSGKVQEVWTLRSSCGEVDEAIAKALRGWAYKPTLVARKPVPICVTITTNVDLR
jgi:hypothetical protein